MNLPWHRRFRSKLIATLFLILAAVTIASMLVAERRYRVVHQRLFEAQFQSYIEAFDASRQRRFEAISEKLNEIAATPALIAHFQGERDGSIRQIIDPMLHELGRQRLTLEQNLGTAMRREPARLEWRGEPGDSVPPPPADPRSRTDGRRSLSVRPPGGPSSEQDAFRPPALVMLLDQNGNPMPKTASDHDERWVQRHPGEPNQAAQTVSLLQANSRPFAEVLAAQQVGYVLTEHPGETRRQVREIFVTPVRDSAGVFLGALAFGLPLPTLDERTLYQQSGRLEKSQIMSGVWVSGHLVSNTIPEASRFELAALIAAEPRGDTPPRQDLSMTVNGQRHRVIYRVLNPESPFVHAVQVNLYSLAALDEEIIKLRLAAAEIAGVAMLLSLGLIVFFSRGLSGPVSALTDATRAVAAGDYTVRVPAKTKDEMGLLTRAFNEMTAGLALRERYRSVLNAVADPAVASRLLVDNPETEGTQKQVSVLFCDIRGFTALSERLPAPVVIELLNQHMTALTAVAYEHGGTVDKFVGDLIMVLFGAPESTEDDALRAVRCALAMRATRARLNREAENPLEVGIGIATGQVVAGCMGSEKRLNYTVIGQRVNLAARLCSQAAAGQIVIDEATLALLPDGFELTSLPPARLKGISEPVCSYAVHKERPSAQPASV